MGVDQKFWDKINIQCFEVFDSRLIFELKTMVLLAIFINWELRWMKFIMGVSCSFVERTEAIGKNSYAVIIFLKNFVGTCLIFFF